MLVVIAAQHGHCDFNGQVTCWHEKSGGERVMSGEFTVLQVFWLSFGHFCSFAT